jgi:hypothetical protein
MITIFLGLWALSTVYQSGAIRCLFLFGWPHSPAGKFSDSHLSTGKVSDFTAENGTYVAVDVSLTKWKITPLCSPSD